MRFSVPSHINTSRVRRSAQVRQCPHIRRLSHGLGTRKRRRKQRSIRPRQLDRTLGHARVAVKFLSEATIGRCVEFDGAHVGVTPALKGLDEGVEARGVFLAGHTTLGRGERSIVFPEGEGGFGDLDDARGGECRSGAVHVFGDGGRAEVPWVTEGGGIVTLWEG